MTITNSGGGTLNWSIDTTGLPDWLIVAPTMGSLDAGDSDNVTLSVDTTGLTEGSYSYVFEIIAPAAQNSPQMITVNLRIGDMLMSPAIIRRFRRRSMRP